MLRHVLMVALVGCASDPMSGRQSDLPDSCPDLVKIRGASTTVTGDVRSWNFELEDLPSTISIAQPGVPADTFEYEWTVTPSETESDVFGARYSHDPGAQRDVALLDGATVGVWVYYLGHTDFTAIDGMSAVATDSTLRLEIPEPTIRAYTTGDHFIFHTAYRSGNQTCVDTYDPVASAR